MRRFFDMLFPPRPDELSVRNTSIEEIQASLTLHTIPSTRPATVVLLSFGDPRVRAAIHEAKYHANARAYRLLASALETYFRKERVDVSECALVPIPLSRYRQKERGYNQVEKIVRAVSFPLPIDTSLLTRVRDTVSQVSLPRGERERNMRDAFSVAHVLDPKKTYFLIDDVLTTGATLQAAIDALSAAGALHVKPIALAH